MKIQLCLVAASFQGQKGYKLPAREPPEKPDTQIYSTLKCNHTLQIDKNIYVVSSLVFYGSQTILPQWWDRSSTQIYLFKERHSIFILQEKWSQPESACLQKLPQRLFPGIWLSLERAINNGKMIMAHYLEII